MEEVEDLRNKLFSKLDDDDGFDNLITNLKNLKGKFFFFYYCN